MVSQTVSIPRDLYFKVEDYALEHRMSFSKAYGHFARMGDTYMARLEDEKKQQQQKQK